MCSSDLTFGNARCALERVGKWLTAQPRDKGRDLLRKCLAGLRHLLAHDREFALALTRRLISPVGLDGSSTHFARSLFPTASAQIAIGRTFGWRHATLVDEWTPRELRPMTPENESWASVEPRTVTTPFSGPDESPSEQKSIAASERFAVSAPEAAEFTAGTVPQSPAVRVFAVDARAQSRASWAAASAAASVAFTIERRTCHA